MSFWPSLLTKCLPISSISNFYVISTKSWILFCICKNISQFNFWPRHYFLHNFLGCNDCGLRTSPELQHECVDSWNVVDWNGCCHSKIMSINWRFHGAEACEYIARKKENKKSIHSEPSIHNGFSFILSLPGTFDLVYAATLMRLPWAPVHVKQRQPSFQTKN